MRRRTIITVGSGDAEVKIYTLRRKDGYSSFQAVWYELRQRKSKTFAKMEAAKLWAQQVSSSCCHELPDNSPASFRDFEILRACDARAKRYGLTLTSAFEEWSDAKTTVKGGSILDAVRFYNTHHAGLPSKSFTEAADEFLAAKEAMRISFDYRRSLRHYLARLKKDFSKQPIADITTAQVDEWPREANGNHTTKNNLRRIFVTMFKWSRDRDYLAPDKKTAPERATTFNGAESAPAIFTPAEMQKVLAVCPDNLLPHMVIGAFSGIRAAEIERLEWSEIMWDRGYIEIKAAKAKTKARRLVQILPNLRAWLEPMKKEQGRVCFLPNLHLRLTYFGEKSGVGWKQNALRHSFASYRLIDSETPASMTREMYGRILRREKVDVAAQGSQLSMFEQPANPVRSRS